MKQLVVCFAVLCLLLSACQAGGTPFVVSTGEPSFAPTPARGYCGDGRCEGPENPQNCPADCKTQSAPTATAPARPTQPVPTATAPARPTQPAPATTAPMRPALSTPTATARPSDGKKVLYLGIMVHLEGWPDDQNQARFNEHARLMRDYATLFEKYGAKLTWESKEVTEGVIKWGDNVLLEMQRRGHGVGVHADIGGQKNYDCRRFAADLRAEKQQLESLGVTVRHVSGIVSHCDWVTAAADAGYLFTTGQVAYSVMSMPIENRPAQFRDCQTPALCHDTFPTALADRLHPWRMNSGADWLTPAPKGRLVLIPSSGGLSHAEEDATGRTSGKGEDFTSADIDYFIRELEQAIALAQPGQVNTYYVSWSFGSPLDKTLLETWLQRIQPYVKAGQVEWKTLPEMYDAYVRWEQDHK